jgi:pimeloyl-ACP methyl ester carboxylesterase
MMLPRAHVVVVVGVAVALAVRAPAAEGLPVTIDAVVAPGVNYDKAEFRLWLADPREDVDAVLVLMPGSNGDGRSMVEEPVWQELAARRRLALLGCRLTDYPHQQPFIERYVNASQGSGQALLEALVSLAGRSGHPELAEAPLLLWGFSAGGELNYELVAWKPERVVAFVVNKGGIYYSALVPEAARKVPGILFVGGKDLEYRTSTIVGLFAVNRRAGALWALAEEPDAAHTPGRSQDVARIFFEDVLPLRLPAREPNPDGSRALRPMEEATGFIGDLETGLFGKIANAAQPDYPTAWLPTERVARAWRALLTGEPLNHD